MPEQNNSNNGSQENSAGAGEAGAANNDSAGQGQGSGSAQNNDQSNGQNQTQQKDQGGGEETITIKKSEWEKTNSDLENYKVGLINRKAEDRSLEKPVVKSGDGQGAAPVIDETKVNEVAITAANKTLRAAGEKTAKRAFLKAHPEYIDDTQWVGLLSHLSLKGDEVTSEDIADRMESALLEHKRATGKLDEHMSKERERGIREGRIQGQIESAGGTGSQGDKNRGEGAGTLSPQGEQMARTMHTDPEKVRKVDLSKDNVIDVMAPKVKK